MKVKNISFYMGDNAIQGRHNAEKNTGKEKGSKTIDGRGTAAASDSIAAKKVQAQKKAMKIIGDAFAGDKQIDDDLNERREKVRTLQKESGENKAAMKDLQDQREKLLAQGYAADSDEVKNLDEQVKSYAELISDAEDEIQMENAVVRQSKIERLKSDPMVKAREQADSVMEAASDEILGDLIAEGKQHIDEKMEEEKKKAEEAKEKKEELEAQIEARKEDKKEQEKLTEDILDAAKELTNAGNAVSDAQQSIKDLMNKMSLVEDDVKGAAVDQGV